MGVLSHQERSADSVRPPVVADGLGDRQDVRFIEGPVERRSSMSARAEAYQLAWIIEVGTPRVVLVFELRDIYQHIPRCWLSCFGMHSHQYLALYRRAPS